MGKLAVQLTRIFDQAIQKKVVSLDALISGKEQAAHNLQTMPSVENLIKKGSDPLHAMYVNMLNLISLFSEEVTTLPPLHAVHDFVSKWLNLYQPSFPPMSPITSSFFTCWTIFDATFGDDAETVCTCFLSLLDRFRVDPIQVEIARNLNQSRMGLYEVLKCNGKICELRELITDKRLTANITSGYQGSPGHLIFIRLVPPLANSVDYHVGMTTPYLLVKQTAEDWFQYFKRHEIHQGTVGVESRLHRHMKYGKTRTYWSEYFFYGYVNYAPGVILITGFPDQQQTQPAHDKYKA
jgi:hypothetical protein